MGQHWVPGICLSVSEPTEKANLVITWIVTVHLYSTPVLITLVGGVSNTITIMSHRLGLLLNIEQCD